MFKINVTVILYGHHVKYIACGMEVVCALHYTLYLVSWYINYTDIFFIQTVSLKVCYEFGFINDES